MPHLTGARALGLDVHWDFGFVENGVHASETPGVVYLDVGGHAGPGVLDHHDGDRDGSTAHVLLDRPDFAYNHLMGPWLDLRARGQSVTGARWEPRIVTHYRPDWDSVVAAHLLMRYIMDGEFPPYAHALAAYASLVDHGRSRVHREFPESLLCPHFAYAVAGYVNVRSNEDLMMSGLALLERTLEDLHAAHGPRPQWDPRLFEVRPDNLAPTRWRTDPRFTPLAEFLLAEPARFAADRARGRVIDVLLPAATTSHAIPVQLFIAQDASTSPLDVYLLRDEGIAAMVRPLPTSIRAGEPSTTTHFPRVMMMVEPDGQLTGGQRINLRGLGYALERAETSARTSDGHVDARGGPPRWDDGSCTSADPWYDGRGHGFTIVDSPRAGTELPYDEIVRIITTTRFWERPLQIGHVVDLWPVAEPSREPRRGMAPFEAIADPLRVLYADSDETMSTFEDPETPDGCRARRGRRRYPVGTSVEYDVLECAAAGEVTIEGLVRAVERRRRLTHPGASPHRTLVWVEPLPCGPHARPVIELLGPLHDGELQPAVAHGTPMWLNPTSVLLVPEKSHPSTQRAVHEVFCYGAFVADTLSAISRRVADVLPRDDQDIDGSGLRDLQLDALRFQARHYQLDVSREPVSMALATAQRDQEGIAAHLAENLAELEQLGTIAQVAAAEREARADRSVQWTLSFVALLSIIQTAAGMLALAPGQAVHPVMLGSYAVAIALVLFILRRGRS
jgi:hypothetical protein